MVESQRQPAGSKIGVTPSLLLLEAAQGGVVNNTDVAMRLAWLLLTSSESPEDLPLEITDRGDKWLIRGKPQPFGPIEIRKRDGAVAYGAGNRGQPTVLPTVQMAQRFGQIIIENARSAAELHRQLPLRVEDKGETWLVAGSGKADPQEGGPSGCRLEMRKRDACVVDFWFGWTLGTHPAIRDPS
jgi:hypothetical protein